MPLRPTHKRAVLAGLATLASAGSLALSLAPANATGLPGAERAAAGGTVKVDTNIRFAGLGTAANTLTISGFGPDRFLLTDRTPIKVGTGCTIQTVGGGLFGAVCRAPVNDEGEFQRVLVDLGAGNDTVTQHAPASLHAQGGDGDDTIVGGSLDDDLFDRAGANTLRGRSGDDYLDTSISDDVLKDVLDGGRGDDQLFAGPSSDSLVGATGDDDMQGGLGADTFDGGSGRDHVSYTDSAHGGKRNFVTFDGVANDGDSPLSGTKEGDNVLDTVEDATGNSGTDFFFGDDDDNHFVGLGGNDFLEGGDGEDRLEGMSGADQIFGDQFLGSIHDGDVDVLDGGTDATDTCRASTIDPDQTLACEVVDNT